MNQLIRLADDFITNNTSSILKYLNPYTIGLSATALGLLLGSFFSDNDYPLLEFQKTVDKESYFEEMKQHFLKRDHFFKLVKYSVLGFIIFFFFAAIFVLYLAYDMFKLKKYINIYFVKNTERINNTEAVIESILKDHEVLDIKQFEFFKNEIEEQRLTFKNFITNRSLEFESTISNAKNVCLKAKNSVRSDLKMVTDMTTKFSTLKNDSIRLDDQLNKSNKSLDTLNKSIENASNKLSNEIEKIKIQSNELFESFSNDLKEQKLDISKCNSLLICSKTLFEASLAIFNDIKTINESEKLNNQIDDDKNKDSSDTIMSCIKKANDINEFLNSQENIEELINNNKLENQPMNILVFELLERLKLVEEKLFNHKSLINNNDIKIQKLETSTTEKISDLKIYSDEWITSWVSVIYGLFNSSFLHLENELFGIDCLEYSTIFDVADDMIEENSKLLYDITDKCKQTCLKIIKEVNLLIFEYYLIQKSFAGSNSTLISLCDNKINEELDTLYTNIGADINKVEINNNKKERILIILMKLKHDLALDLKDDTRKFNILVRQNLEDFCIIHDTMKTIFKKSEDKSSTEIYFDEEDNREDDDSIIEIYSPTNSVTYNTSNSSYSENDNSMESIPSSSSLRPFKLSVKKRRN